MSAWSVQAVAAVKKVDVNVTARDGTELSLSQYSANGPYLAIWIANGYGLSPRDELMARELARIGVEVWQIDFSQALFQVGGSNFLRKLNPNYVVDLINAAQKRTAKQVVVISHSYGAIPALRGATLWQQESNPPGRLLGVILISPDLYASIPTLGLPPDYLPIAHATTIPIMIFQAGKRGNAGQFPKLLRALTANNPHVYFKYSPNVISSMYLEDSTPPTLKLLKQLPGLMRSSMDMFSKLPAAVIKKPQYAYRTEKLTPLDSRLTAYRGHPSPGTIALRSADNRRYTIDDYKGKVSVINFWATWCHPCREEIPSLNRLREKMHGKPFQLISVNYAESAAEVKAFLKHAKVDYPVLLDSKGKVSTDWNVIAFPSTFVIGSDGKIHYGVNAAIEWDSPRVIQLLDGLMPGRINDDLPASAKDSRQAGAARG